MKQAKNQVAPVYQTQTNQDELTNGELEQVSGGVRKAGGVQQDYFMDGKSLDNSAQVNPGQARGIIAV